MHMKKPIILSILLPALIISSSVLYKKNVQKENLIQSFKTYIQSSNYKEAVSIKQKAEDDILISNLLGFDKYAKSITENQYKSIRNDYLSGKIAYNDFNERLIKLDAFNYIDNIESEKQNINKIEDLRKKYREAQELAGKKDYKEAISVLNEIDSSIDSNYKPKVSNLKSNITSKIQSSLNLQITKALDDEDYTKALSLLNSNKSLIYDNFYKNQSTQIANFKAKKLNERKEQIIVALNNLSSFTQYLVWVDISSQKTNIYTGSKGNWTLIKSFSCSTGKTGEETPTGTFSIKDKGSWFFSKKYQEGAKYWVRIFDNYLFHSFPMNENKQIIDTTLGSPSSHGCIRLNMNDIKWFYNNIKYSTTVYIK